MGKLSTWLRNLRRYPSLAAGVIIVALFFAISIYTLIAIPYSEGVLLWRGGPGVWDDYPKNARPLYYDLFTRDRLPRTVLVTSQDEGTRHVEPLAEDTVLVEITLPFTYSYDGFPREISVFTTATFQESNMPIAFYWRTPDGRTITVREERLTRRGTDTYHISQDTDLIMRLDNTIPHQGLFADPAHPDTALKGDYQLVLQAQLHEDDELEAKLLVYGQIHGLAGTDHKRRDLMVALLWGAPVGLAFGILAAVGAQVSTFVLAGIGTWFGGKLERIFQWLTQVNSVLPMLPILIMIGYFYSRSIWLMLGLVIALNVFSASMFTYRAMFLQAREAPYFEAAQAYGAGNWRIIFRYLLPRLAPTLLPQFVTIIPTFVFLEATLAVLGLGDPKLPTWGKVMNDAYGQGALYKGYYYWITQPAILLMLMGVGFSLVGFALDRIFNPRLRTV
ncbi:MAG: ABC transporter permease [Dehalococcoidia bacterium]